jgi:hypothetical protein
VAEGWTLSFVGDREVIEAIGEAEGAELEIGQTMPLESEIDALDSPIGADEIRQALELVTVFAGSASALVGLAGQVVDLVKRFGKPVDVSAGDGQKLLTVTPDTDRDELIAAMKLED